MQQIRFIHYYPIKLRCISARKRKIRQIIIWKKSCCINYWTKVVATKATWALKTALKYQLTCEKITSFVWLWLFPCSEKQSAAEDVEHSQQFCLRTLTKNKSLGQVVSKCLGLKNLNEIGEWWRWLFFDDFAIFSPKYHQETQILSISVEKCQNDPAPIPIKFLLTVCIRQWW